MKLSDGVIQPVAGLGNNPWGVRVHGETFHFIVGGSPPQLWSVDATGSVMKLGDYAPVPPGTKGGSLMKPILAPDDTFYSGAFDAKIKDVEIMYRQKIDGTSEIFYTETSMPKVYMSTGLPFITGP